MQQKEGKKKRNRTNFVEEFYEHLRCITKRGKLTLRMKFCGAHTGAQVREVVSKGKLTLRLRLALHESVCEFTDADNTEQIIRKKRIEALFISVLSFLISFPSNSQLTGEMIRGLKTLWGGKI